MPSTNAPQPERWSKEAARTASNWVAGAIVLVTIAAAVVTPLTDWVPDKHKAQVTTIVGALGAIAAGLTKVQSSLTRSNVWSSSTHYAALEDQARAIANRGTEPLTDMTSAPVGAEPPLPTGMPVIPIPGDPGPSGQEAAKQAAQSQVAPRSQTSWSASEEGYPQPSRGPDPGVPERRPRR